ncbi:MAG: glycosyl hydrolase 115 family protein [Butyrivibrio sp.]|uniref:glycosyl hydrolase 115 family protein n=1 Tax=Butyrivibrio sp. TaxID=28121 RepID=UPI0025BB3F99|nr:glycosyl hydrolase 115 family protein [Butyrivibrio sp.]MBQ6589214.1 glycosyl hydrolase 115 family protein [Butyrivibrio sp.]
MITYNTKLIDVPRHKPVQIAADALRRDIICTCLESDKEGIDISFVKDDAVVGECYVITAFSDKVQISASDDLGFVYGIYHISKKFLGVNEFWFWNEQIFEKREGYEVPEDYHFEAKPYSVRFRGWFINDEVLFDGWKKDKDDNRPWEMAFETLLRLGGNMTIPGTDFNAHIYKKLAADYGLWITHHHAEPLGARMFARAYPELEASYDRYPELFEGLWKEAIEDQKECKVIWNLGFRGQGDRPFWADDPAYDSDEKRGELMSSLIRKQYDLVKAYDSEAVCCSNLYGETMELYKKGLLDIPEDVIFIWADNGFGKMVSRRQGNHNPRVYALPENGAAGRHGIYYHASFYDLQAAAQMTMLPNSPEFVVKELTNVYEVGADDFWIINCSNVKPHAYILDLIARMWREPLMADEEALAGEAPEYVNAHLSEYCQNYYADDHLAQIQELYQLWPGYSPSYGPNEDDHSGEQFAHHGARVLTTGFITDFDKKNPSGTRAADEWLWFSDKKTLREQLLAYRDVIEPAQRGYEEYLVKCRQVLAELPESTRQILEDTLVWQVEYLYYSYLGALYAIKSMDACLVDASDKVGTDDDQKEKVIDCISQGQDREGEPDYLTAFYEAGLAAQAFLAGYDKMRSHEHGDFDGFFDNDCEADIRQSYYVMKGLMSFVRFHGDGPHFYKWQRMFQEGAGGNKVHLILRVRKHLTDDELWELMDLALNK